jgi:hypothetical protein
MVKAVMRELDHEFDMLASDHYNPVSPSRADELYKLLDEG